METSSLPLRGNRKARTPTASSDHQPCGFLPISSSGMLPRRSDTSVRLRFCPRFSGGRPACHPSLLFPPAPLLTLWLCNPPVAHPRPIHQACPSVLPRTLYHVFVPRKRIHHPTRGFAVVDTQDLLSFHANLRIQFVRALQFQKKGTLGSR